MRPATTTTCPRKWFSKPFSGLNLISIAKKPQNIFLYHAWLICSKLPQLLLSLCSASFRKQSEKLWVHLLILRCARRMRKSYPRLNHRSLCDRQRADVVYHKLVMSDSKLLDFFFGSLCSGPTVYTELNPLSKQLRCWKGSILRRSWFARSVKERTAPRISVPVQGLYGNHPARNQCNACFASETLLF